MNILVVCHYHYQGTSVPTALFVHAQMQCYAQMGHRVRVVVPIAVGRQGEDGKRFGPAVSKTTVDGIEHVFLRHISLSNFGNKGLNSRLAVSAAKRHYKAITEDFVPDVVQGHKLGVNTQIAMALGRKAGCPVVFSLHGETSCEEPFLSDPAQIARHAEGADKVVCVSSALKRNVQAHWNGDAAVILNGFSLEHVASSAPKQGLVLNQTGYLVPGKRVNITLQAFAALQKKHPEAMLDLVGDGVLRQELEQQAQDLGVASSVTFHGYLPHPEAIAKMSGARFFVMASKPEGFGIVYPEAMASGCITIGTETEGIADLIVNGENGFLVPADDPDAITRVIETCLQDPEGAEKIAQRGRQAALSLTWEKNARCYADLFEGLINKE